MFALIVFLILASLALNAWAIWLLITGITGVVVWKIVVGGLILATSLFGQSNIN